MDLMDLIKYLRTEFPKRFERKHLTEKQLEFLQNLIPFGIVLQQQTYEKSLGTVPTYNGLYASVAMSDIIVRTNWGTHPAVIDHTVNNLGLLTKASLPELACQTKKILGKQFRKYISWYEACDELSTYYVYSGLFEKVLIAKNCDEQMDLMKDLYRLQNIETFANIEEIIINYGLVEFDSYYMK